MAQKSFLVKVDFEIKKITCPGVWLCSNGSVSLQLYMLDSCIQTDSYKPIFPINLNEKFSFYKNFNRGRLNDLERRLNREWFYVEFIQWENPEDGCVLASFQTTLDELLYPKTQCGIYEGVDMDLLMDPTKLFPGTLSPKLLIKTKTTIEENLCNNLPSRNDPMKIVLSSRPNAKRNHSKRVCHSLTYNGSQKCWSDKDNIKKKSNAVNRHKSRSPGRDNDANLRRSPIKTNNCSTWKLDSPIKSENVSPTRGTNNACKCRYETMLYCPTCYEYTGIFSTLNSNCKRHAEVIRRYPTRHENLTDRETCCSNLESPSILAKRLHERLTECLCRNANLVRAACNRCIDFD